MTLEELNERVKAYINKNPELMIVCKHLGHQRAKDILASDRPFKRKLRLYVTEMCALLVLHDKLSWVLPDNFLQKQLELFLKTTITDVDDESVALQGVEVFLERATSFRQGLVQSIALAMKLLANHKVPLEPQDRKTTIIATAEEVKEKYKHVEHFAWSNIFYDLLKMEPRNTPDYYSTVVSLALAYHAYYRKESNYTMIWEDIKKQLPQKKNDLVELFQQAMEHSPLPKVILIVASVAMKELKL